MQMRENGVHLQYIWVLFFLLFFFIINKHNLVDLGNEDLKSDPDLLSFSPIDGYVCYGAVVKFIDCVTGLSLPPMVFFIIFKII